MPGRRTKNVTNPQAHEAWNERKREINASNTISIQFQRLYRIACLKERATKGRLTGKNRAEMVRLGMQ